jgi:hypothetical protein
MSDLERQCPSLPVRPWRLWPLPRICRPPTRIAHKFGLVSIQNAVNSFDRALQHCDNLIKVHRAAGTGARGRRSAETSVNRGTVVLALATWQAFVQDIAAALRDAVLIQSRSQPASSPLVAAALSHWEGEFTSAIERFSTPGPDQSRALLMRAGFDPYPSWSWTQKGGRASGSVTVQPNHVATVINQWLRVRHDVAHGHATVHPLPILTAVRDPRSSASARANPTLRLTDAIDCVAFFRSVAWLTSNAAANFGGSPVPTWPEIPPLALGLHVSNL